MSTNYYVHTPDGQEIHLGQYAAGGFLFRADPERGVVDYATWRAQFDLGVIRAESGYDVTPAEMEATAATYRDRADYRRSHYRQHSSPRRSYELWDDVGRRYLTTEFS